MSAVFLVDVIRDIVAATSTVLLSQLQETDPLITGVHFKYGHINDIRERITTDMKNGINFCPFVCLIEDYRIIKKDEGLTGVADLKLLILYYSKPDITRQQREDNVFRPILYPIYNELLRQFKLSGKFQIYDVTKIQHEHINRPHWGDPGLYGNKEYPLTGVFDGIEISNLQLTTFLQNCL